MREALLARGAAVYYMPHYIHWKIPINGLFKASASQVVLDTLMMIRTKLLLAWTTLFKCALTVIGSPIRNASALGVTPECWDPHRAFVPLTFRDCFDVFNQEISRGQDPDIPLKFSRFASERPDVLLPVIWISRQGPDRHKCFVALDVGSDAVTSDRTTLNDIKRAAMSVARECVIKEPHLGGVLRLGWHGSLGVMLMGHRGLLSNSRNGTLDVSQT